MTHLIYNIYTALAGKTLVTAESCTGGGIGAALTSVPGSSKVYKGGIISYTDWVKENVLGVPGELLRNHGAVSAPVAQAMAEGVRDRLQTDVAVSVTGLAGPDGDDRGNPVGTVFIGYCDERKSCTRHYCFEGSREEVQKQAVEAALRYVFEEYTL